MSYRFLEHTADLRMAAEGKDLQDLFSEALRGMMHILKPAGGEGKEANPALERLTIKGGVKRTLKIEAGDRTSLLIDFLNETLLLAQTHKEIYAGVKFKEFGEHRLEAELTGHKIDSFAEDIKAVTYHEAEVKNENGIWKTNIIFDI